MVSCKSLACQSRLLTHYSLLLPLFVRLHRANPAGGGLRLGLACGGLELLASADDLDLAATRNESERDRLRLTRLQHELESVGIEAMIGGRVAADRDRPRARRYIGE